MTVGVAPDRSTAEKSTEAQSTEAESTVQSVAPESSAGLQHPFLRGASEELVDSAQQEAATASDILSALDEGLDGSADITQDPVGGRVRERRGRVTPQAPGTPQAQSSATPDVHSEPAVSELVQQDPVVTNAQKIVLKPAGIDIEGYRELTIDPNSETATATTKRLHKLLKQIQEQGGEVIYSLNRHGDIEFDLRYKGIEQNIRVRDRDNWQGEMLTGVDALVIKSALGDPSPSQVSQSVSSKRDFSTATHEELVAAFKDVHQDLFVADLELRHKTDLLEVIEQSSNDPRRLSQGLNRWAANATRDIQRQSADTLGFSFDVTADRSMQIAQLEKQLARDIVQLQRQEQQVMNLAKREYEQQLRFDTSMQQQLGGRKVDELLREVGNIEVSSDVKAKVDGYRHHDIKSNLVAIANGADINPFPEAIDSKSIDFGISEITQPDPFSNSRAASSAFAGKTEELRAYLTKLEAERVEREASISSIDERIEYSGVLTGSSAQRVENVENMIDGLSEINTLAQLQTSNGMSLQDQKMIALLEQCERNQEVREKLEGARDYLSALQAHGRDANRARGVYVRAIKRSYLNQFGREIDRGIQRGSRDLGREIGGIAEDWAKKAGKEIRDILGPKK